MTTGPPAAFIHEIFSSVQGEGLLIGLWQIFVRFRGCSLQCRLCDTPDAREQSSAPAHIYQGQDPSSSHTRSNPVSRTQLDDLISGLEVPGRVHSHITVTGGEPLEQNEFLADWLPSISRRSSIMLETNAVHYDQVEQIKKYISFAAMDYKLPSFTGGTSYRDSHLRFYRVMTEIPGCIKIIVTPRTTLEEISDAESVIRESGSRHPVIIQPVPECRTMDPGTFAKNIKNMTVILKKSVAEVRCIPQMHPDWKLK